MRKIKLLILRGHDLEKPNFVPNDGELCWGKDTNTLYIGDGITPICKLNGISNVCKSPNGKLYKINIDDFGFTTVEPLTNKTTKYHMELYVR